MASVSCEHNQFVPAKVGAPVILCRGCGSLVRDPRHPANAGLPALVARPEQAQQAAQKGAH
jgi:hypothetical protein